MMSNGNYRYQYITDLHKNCGNGVSLIQFYKLLQGDEFDYVCKNGELKYTGKNPAIKNPRICSIHCKCVCHRNLKT